MPRPWVLFRPALLATFLFVQASFGAVTATFTLQPAAGQQGTTINLGQRLDLDVLVTLNGSSTPLGVTGVSFFMDLQEPEGGIVSFKGWSKDPAFDVGSPSGTPNTPLVGEFAAGAVMMPIGLGGRGTTTFTDGQPKRIGTFAVEGVKAGSLDYQFAAAGGLVWQVGLSGGTVLEGSSLSNGPSLTIDVVPEPGCLLLISLAGCLATARRRQRF